VPLYTVGKRMLASYPHVPTGYELGVVIAVQSYAGKMCFGLTADAAVVADVNRLRDFLHPAWEELCRAAGVRKPAAAPRKRRAPKPRHAPAA
jgi:diacylglycerol O-acyltransferase